MESLQTLSKNDQAFRIGYEDVSPSDSGGSKDGLAVLEEEYWEKYYHDPDFTYEWNNGYLEEKPVSDQKGSEVYQWFCDIIRCYIRTYPLGRISNLDIGFRLAIPGRVEIRRPDLALVLNENSVAINDDDFTYKGVFDLCVESLSYSKKKDIQRDTVQKKAIYGGGGVKEYYIIDARGIETAFYRLNRRGGYVSIRQAKGGIVKSGILPGFQFRISDLYSRPPLEKLAEDPIYCNYVFPIYKEMRQRAEHAEKLLDIEKQRAERLAEKLRSMGMDPD